MHRRSDTIARILIVRNDYDTITHYMHEWSKPVIEAAENNGIKVDCVDGKNVIRSEVTSRIGKVNPSFIFLNGHGDDKTFYGYQDQVLIEPEDAGIFKERIVFSRACNCAKGLGRHAVQMHGCTSFIGYEFEFVNVRRTSTEVIPLKDEISRPIWEASNAVPLSLIKGSAVDESIEASHKRAARDMLRLVFSGEIGSIEVLKALIANDEALAYHGDGSAKI